ncbi:HAD family hydrolase [Algoriphagus formosus]|uniref:HAD family hydrolase n=1 Tax=Algoriphagus formosus TaxID=2007308 RepID=UPI003F70C92A
MKNKLLIFLLFILASACAEKNTTAVSGPTSEELQLTSWNDGATRSAIEDFVRKTTTEGSTDFIPEEDRIAVFDNDGTLWAEQPMYFQLFYAIDFIKKNASDHPEWSEIESIQAILQDDLKAALDGGTQAILELVMVSHSDMTAEEFAQSVRSWLQESRHPQTGKPYNQMIYQPMVELLELLRANGYKTFIVSGGGIDFLRVWAEEAYGIPPYQVVGSSLKAKYEEQNGKMEIIKIPELNFIDDKEGKPVGIHQHLGMKPIIAGGNSDGDYQMIEYTTQGSGPSLGIYIHHTDSIREYAYDRESHIGRLDKGLDDAARLGWLVVDMAKDWKTIYPE